MCVDDSRARECCEAVAALTSLPSARQWYQTLVTRHTSHITRHMSHVTRHTAHITRPNSHVLQQPHSHHPCCCWLASCRRSHLLRRRVRHCRRYGCQRPLSQFFAVEYRGYSGCATDFATDFCGEKCGGGGESGDAYHARGNCCLRSCGFAVWRGCCVTCEV
jgi:hypothetical protein